MKYEQFSGGFNDGNNEEPGWSGISKKKSEGDGSRAHGSRLKYVKNISFSSFSMGPKCMKYQEIKKSDWYWSRKLIKKTNFQVSGGPHIIW